MANKKADKKKVDDIKDGETVCVHNSRPFDCNICYPTPQETTPLTKATSAVEAMIGRILVRPAEFHYGGLIAIPEKAKRRPTVGTIVQLNLTENPNQFEVGQRVVYGVYSGTPVLLTIDQVETPLIVITPEEILVRLHGKTELKEAGQGY